MVIGKMGNVFYINYDSKVTLKERNDIKKEIHDFDNIHILASYGNKVVYLPNPCIIYGDLFIYNTTFHVGPRNIQRLPAAYIRNVRFDDNGDYFKLCVPFQPSFLLDIMECKHLYDTGIETISLSQPKYINGILRNTGTHTDKIITGDFLIKDGELAIPHNSVLNKNIQVFK